MGYDFFISYESHDVTIARMVAEQIKACGGNPWFAEYSTPAEDWARMCSEWSYFEQTIKAAIDASARGICFTSKRYWESKYCRFEFDYLLDSKEAAGVVEIPLHPYSPIPASSAHSLAVGEDAIPLSSEINRILRHIASVVGSVIPCSQVDFERRTATRRQFRIRGQRFFLEAAGWNIEEPPKWQKVWGWIDGDAAGPHFSIQSEYGKLWGHLLVGKQDTQRTRPKNSRSAKDLEYYSDALQLARHFYGHVLRQSLVGMHLLFLKNHSHAAFTTQSSHLMSMWSRLYSVVLPHPSRRYDLEYAFFFFFRGSLREFVGSAYLMDRLVLSFHPEG